MSSMANNPQNCPADKAKLTEAEKVSPNRCSNVTEGTREGIDQCHIIFASRAPRALTRKITRYPRFRRLLIHQTLTSNVFKLLQVMSSKLCRLKISFGIESQPQTSRKGALVIFLNGNCSFQISSSSDASNFDK